MIASFPHGYYTGSKQRPLTKSMIASLLILCAKQKDKISLSFRDACGSFTTLAARGLIVNEEIIKDGKKESGWHVTAEAIAILTGLGLEVPL